MLRNMRPEQQQQLRMIQMQNGGIAMKPGNMNMVRTAVQNSQK